MEDHKGALMELQAAKENLPNHVEIARSEERFRMAMEAAKIGTYDWDINTGEIFWSDNLKDAMGMPAGNYSLHIDKFNQFIFPDDHQHVQLAIADSLKTGADYQTEFRMVRVDGSIRWVQARGKVYFDDSGRPVRLVGIDIDITQHKLSEARLLVAEQKYSDFYDHAPDLLFSINAVDGTVLECNQTACNTLGFTKDEMVGRSIVDLYHPDSQTRRAEAFEQFRTTGSIQNVELKMRRKDGSVLDVSLNASAVRENGKIVRSRSICRDITALKRTQQSLEQSEMQARARAEELTAILDAVPAATFIAHDAQCTRMTSSRAAYELLRLPPGSNSSKSAPVEERPSFQIVKDGKPVPTSELPMQTAAATGLPVRDSEMRVVFEDGTWCDIFGHAIPLLTDSGEVRGAVGAFVDITALKQAQEDVRRSEARLRTFVDSSLIGVVQESFEEGIKDANDVFLKMLGYSRAELLERHHSSVTLTAPELLPRTLQSIEEIKITGEFAPFENHCVRKDGTRVPVLMGAAAYRREPLEWTCFVLDLTERKAMEELRLREEVQSQLLDREIVACETERRRIARELHDQAGQTMASLLAGLRLIDDARKLKEVKALAVNLRKLVGSGIDELERLARGLHPLALDDFGLEAALRHQIREYSDLHRIPANLRIEGLESERLPQPYESGLYRIVQEALTNTAKYGKAKSVSVAVRRTGRTLSLHITDDGCGFNANELQSATSEFLGLRGMRERVSMLGGEFTLVSQIGKGTTISVTIPLPLREPSIESVS